MSDDCYLPLICSDNFTCRPCHEAAVHANLGGSNDLA